MLYRVFNKQISLLCDLMNTFAKSVQQLSSKEKKVYEK